MNFVISIGTFFLGFFAEKILDIIIGALKKKIERRKRKQILNNFYTDLHQDVLITASAFPFYYPKQIKEDISNRTPFKLATPAGVSIGDASSFSNVDCVTDGFKEYIQKKSLQEQLEKARRDVFKSFSTKNDGNYFNGKVLGVNYLNGFIRSEDVKETPVLDIDFYETDYYTHKIIEQLMQNVTFNSDMLKDPTNFSWIRTSFGVSIILIVPKHNEIILTKRSGNAAYNEGKEWIYVSVTETLSETDYSDETGCPDLRKCVLRGISEELGITERELNIDTLRFYDAFYETHFHQDNIVASIEISDELAFPSIYSLLAKDKFLEISEIFTISNDKKSIIDFIEINRNIMKAQTIFSLGSFAARK